MPDHHKTNYDPDSAAPSTLKEQLGSVQKLWPYLWPKTRPEFKLRIIGALCVILIGQFIAIGSPLLLEESVNRLADKDPRLGILGGVMGFIIGYGILRVSSVAIPQLREMLFAKVGQNTQREVALDVFKHLHALSMRFHLERRTGGLSRVIERGIKSIDFLFRVILFNIGPTLLQLIIVSFLFALRYEPSFALVAIGTVMVYFWFTASSTEWRLKFRREMNKLDTEANTKAIDSLLNYETVKYFNNEAYEADRYNQAMRGYQDAAVQSNNSLAIVNAGQALIFNAGLVVILLITAREIMAGTMEIGAVTSISLIMMTLYQPLNILGFAYREIKQSLIDMEKMFNLLNVNEEVKDSPNALPLQVPHGQIRFENVCFRYEENRQILKGISFDVPAGSKTALVGHSGAGKSTISRILYRFYNVESGDVLIDEQSISGVTQDSLRKSIGIVPQDTVLFNDSIAYNIAYAKPNATHEEVEQAARLAQIHEFVQSLPEGYYTMVGERGLKLSGGEKQRVAIARTILKNPPILILDEATSALDSVTEGEIQQALREVSSNRTSIVIAHRLSTIIDSDQIIVLKNGLIVERGTHTELLALRGEYESLWLQQQESDGA